MRPIDLDRGDAELLDDLLKAYFEKSKDYRAKQLGDEICRIWGMSTWERRFDIDATETLKAMS